MDKKPDLNNGTLPSVGAIELELKRERYKRRYKRILKSTVYALIIVAAVAVLIATLILPVLQISGTSMEPTLHDDDIVVLIKSKELKRGDLCGFYYSNKILIKRVIALPGEVISIDTEGNVVVNGEELNEPYVSEKGLGECDVEFPFEVPEGEYFLMGDHRQTSIDSRSSVIGCVARDEIIGRIVFKACPLSDFGFLK